MAGSGLESELLSATGIEWSHSLETGKNNPLCSVPRGVSQASTALPREEESYYRHPAKHWSRLATVGRL